MVLFGARWRSQAASAPASMIARSRRKCTFPGPKMSPSFVRCLFLAFLGTMPFISHAQVQNDDIYGKWRIKTFAGSADSFGLSEQQIHALTGKPILISAEKFVFNGKTCTHPTYKRSVETTTTYFRREWQADSSELPLPSTVTIIETGCNILYPIRKDHMIIAEESGVFFEAVRVKRLPGKP